MLYLPAVSLVTVNTRAPRAAAAMLSHCADKVEFGEVILFTDLESIRGGVTDDPRIEVSPIRVIHSRAEYSRFMMKDLPKFNFSGRSHVLVTQTDGYVLNADKWSDEFLEYDYIGAPIIYAQDVVGNGGFSLRSLKLLRELSVNEIDYSLYHDEDYAISIRYRARLEAAGILYAPIAVARRFATETGDGYENPLTDTFGFHSRDFCEKFGVQDFEN